MLTIRLQRRGRRKRPLHHIVVADSRKPRDGRIIEDLGRFDNVTPKNQLTLNRERALYWLKQGAQPSDTVRSIFKNQGIMYEMHLIRWGKSEEEIEAALEEWREAREAKEKEVPTRKERQKALLEAEEKEYQKQLKKKAEEAAKEKAKQEALASDEDEDEDETEEARVEADDEEEVAEETAAAEETSEPETPAEDEKSPDTETAAGDDATETEDEKAPDTEEEDVELEAEVEDEAQAVAEADKSEEPSEDEEAEAEVKEAEKAEEEESKDKADEEPEQTSTDMLAKEAIAHIEDNSLEDLEGFVTDDEDRVTVQRAWEDKQEE